jgi:sialic acid synthase SpsE
LINKNKGKKMSNIISCNGKKVQNFGRPYIIAEVNSSHGGSVETAKEMIKRAKDVGCDCVKFQSWSTESLYSKTFYKSNPIAKRLVEKFALSETELLDIVEYCKSIDIAFASTPYSTSEVDFLVDKCNVPFVKIASMEINNYDYIEYIGRKGIPVILSTGMADFAEIEKAVTAFEKSGNPNLILLHCISIYPAPVSTTNLNNLKLLQERFPKYSIGFSDHSYGTEIASAAVALGAAVIEKHFTLDKSKMGMDNNMAIEPEEFATLVKNCHNVFEAMGSKDRIVSKEEYAQREKMRRSLVVVRDMQAGETITLSDLDAKRPGNGIPPERKMDLVGRVLKTNVAADHLIFDENLV